MLVFEQSVQVMGSFDGWNQGEDMSPEYTGGANKFSAELKLRPGRFLSLSLPLSLALSLSLPGVVRYLILAFTALQVRDQIFGGWRLAAVTRSSYFR